MKNRWGPQKYVNYLEKQCLATCPNIILPSVFYSMDPVPVSVVEYLKLCNKDGKMRNKRFTKLHEPSVKNLLHALKQETADDSLILIRQK